MKLLKTQQTYMITIWKGFLGLCCILLISAHRTPRRENQRGKQWGGTRGTKPPHPSIRPAISPPNPVPNKISTLLASGVLAGQDSCILKHLLHKYPHPPRTRRPQTTTTTNPSICPLIRPSAHPSAHPVGRINAWMSTSWRLVFLPQEILPHIYMHVCSVLNTFDNH